MLFTVYHIGKSTQNPDLFDVDFIGVTGSAMRLAMFPEDAVEKYPFGSQHMVTIEEYVAPGQQEVSK